MTVATSRHAGTSEVGPARRDVHEVDGWHVDLGQYSTFDHVVQGVVVKSVDGPGFAEFDSFVSRFAPSGYGPEYVRDLVVAHRVGLSPIIFRVTGNGHPGMLVGASYKSTIDEIIGSVWEGSCDAIAGVAAAAGVVAPVYVHCDHPTSESAAAALGGVLRNHRHEFVHSIHGELENVAEVLDAH